MCRATILIAAWNAAETIDRSLRSAFRQNDVEVVVIDDASDDAISEKLAHRSDIVFSRLEDNGGPAKARNLGLELATGDWIAVLDADDTMKSGRLERMIAHAERQNADIVLGNFQHVDEHGIALEQTPFLPPETVDPLHVITLEEYVGRNQVSRHSQSIGYLKPLLSRNFIERAGLRYNPDLRNGEDCHLIFQALAAGARVVISPEPDYLYTERRGSISHRINPDHLERLISADHAFLDDYGPKLSNQTRALFRNRENGLREMMMSERVLNALKSHDFRTATKVLRQRPRTVLRVSRQILEGLGRKLRKT